MVRSFAPVSKLAIGRFPSLTFVKISLYYRYYYTVVTLFDV